MNNPSYRTNFQSALSTTAVAVKTTGGHLYGIEVSNPNVVSEWIQIFDALTANITLGTTTPKLSLAVPKGASATDVGIMDKLWEDGIDFSIGITVYATSAPTTNGAPSTGLTANILFY